MLVIGFNELNTVLMDPMNGAVYKYGMNDSAQLFENNGNHFITYITEG
jgi:glutathionyl-hydroquinone reductase